MSTTGNEAVVRRLLEEGFNRGNMAVLDEVLAADYVDHNPYAPSRAAGVEGAREAYAAYRAAFPDGRLTIDEVIAVGDRVATRTTFRGTHQGSFAGVEPTGWPVTMLALDIWYLAGGKIVARWHLEDDLGLLQQLNVIPAMGLTPAEL